MSIHSKTSISIFLLGFLNKDKVYYFISENQSFPGIHIETPTRVPIVDPMIEKIEAQLSFSLNRHKFYLYSQFCETITLENGQQASLFLAKYDDQELLKAPNWQTFPQLLRHMPKSKNRLSYLKAWQVLTGAWQEEIEVVEKKD